MKSKSTKIVSILLTVLVLVGILGAFSVMTSAADPTATLSFANKAQRTTFTTSQQIWEQNGIKLTNDKASSSNNVADYAGPARFYAGSKITIEMPGKLISKIVFDCNSASYATSMKNSIGTITTGTVTVSSDKVTVVLNSPVESFVVAKMSAQVRMDSLTVSYTEASTDTPTCEHKNTSTVDNGSGTHKIVCDDCEAVVRTEAHKNTAPVDAGNGSHKVECTVCHAVTEEKHINKATCIDKEKHSVECSVCGLVAEEAHNSDTVCTICGWVAPGHSFALKLTFDNITKRTEFTTTKQVWEENGIVLTNDKASSSSNIGDYINPARFYKSSKVTIAFPGMTSISFDCNGSEYSTALKSSITSGTVTVSGNTVTVTFSAPVDSFTVSLTEGKVFVNSITVYGSAPADCTHENTTCVDNGNGTHKVLCSECEEVITAEEAHTSTLKCDKCDYVAPLRFSAWSLSLQDNIAINFAIKADLFAGLYSAPSVTFTIGERTVVVSEFDSEKYEGYYTFTLHDIAPHQMGVNVGATITATCGGESVTASTKASIKAYCMQLLADEGQSAVAKTLIVDLLNYGAASQTYVGATDTLVNADLTDAQKAFGTQGDVTLNNVADANYQTVENATVTWKGAALTLIDTVEMNFYFEAQSAEGLLVKITTDKGKTYTVTEFTNGGEGVYVANFNVFSACQMSEVVYVTVCDTEGNAVSNTYRYSIESYAAAKMADENANLATLVVAMMKYGNSAKNYLA